VSELRISCRLIGSYSTGFRRGRKPGTERPAAQGQIVRAGADSIAEVLNECILFGATVFCR